MLITPTFLSNTAAFYKAGSTGINIEADPALIKNFIKYRPRDINLNIGVTDSINNKEMDFYIINSPTLNTFSKEEAEGYSKKGDYEIVDVIKIKTITINDIIKEYCKGWIPDFLTLDVEGIDEMVIKSLDFNSFSPKVICIETVEFNTSGIVRKKEGLIKYLIDKGYMIYADTYNNTIFVDEKLWVNR